MELVSYPNRVGMKALKNKTVILYPANSTGNTVFTADANSRILFNVPAYSNSFLSTSRCHFDFKVKVKSTAVGGSDGSGGTLPSDAGQIKMVDGLPFIERMVIRGGNGILLEDIRS